MKSLSHLFLIFFYSILFFFGNLACESVSSLEKEISSIPVEIEIDRFDLKFFNTETSDLGKLKSTYPYLFPKQFSDSVWLRRKNDSLEMMIQEEVNAIFPTLDSFEVQLKPLFQHIKFYFPNTGKKKIIGLTNRVDYQNKIIYTDSLLLISLDTYLGRENSIYEGIPTYILKDMDVSYFASHVADEFANTVISRHANRTFLDEMIYYGKKMYLKDILLSKYSDAIKMCYTPEEIVWANENERYIWQYFIENELIYNTEYSIIQRFIEAAPFSKFYLEIDRESPGKIGQWLGWQIVRSYVKNHPNKLPQEIIAKPALELFQASNYKPRR